MRCGISANGVCGKVLESRINHGRLSRGIGYQSSENAFALGGILGVFLAIRAKGTTFLGGMAFKNQRQNRPLL
jgi:hypothetical protein